jgi:predicted aspartyl protease
MLPNGSTLAIEFVIDTGFTVELCLPPEAVSLLRFPFIYEVPANLAHNLKAIRF